MTTRSLARALLVASICSVAGLTPAQAQPAPALKQADEPAAIIISYKALAGKRIEFRRIMQTEGLSQFDHWKQAGVLASYQALFSAYAASDTPDLFLIVRFTHFGDLARWQKIEETYPGGLVQAAQSIASADTSGTAEIVGEDTAASHSKASQFLVLEYDVTASMPRYTSYVTGYVIPQFEGWMKAGILSSFSCYTNQNPAGAAWSSFIVLEYKNLASLAARDVVKDRVRAELAASNPAWKRWSDDKTEIRKEKVTLPAVSLR